MLLHELLVVMVEKNVNNKLTLGPFTEQKARAQQQKLHVAEQVQLIKDQADNNEDNDNLCTPSFGQVRLKSPNGNPALGSAKKRRRIADVKEQDEGSKPLQANQPKVCQPLLTTKQCPDISFSLFVVMIVVTLALTKLAQATEKGLVL